MHHDSISHKEKSVECSQAISIPCTLYCDQLGTADKVLGRVFVLPALVVLAVVLAIVERWHTSDCGWMCKTSLGYQACRLEVELSGMSGCMAEVFVTGRVVVLLQCESLGDWPLPKHWDLVPDPPTRVPMPLQNKNSVISIGTVQSCPDFSEKLPLKIFHLFTETYDVDLQH